MFDAGEMGGAACRCLFVPGQHPLTTFAAESAPYNLAASGPFNWVCDVGQVRYIW
jgi:hypothetical protein